MTLPSSGVITLAQVRKELGRTSGSISLGESAVRALAGRPSGSISMSQLRGKSSVFKGTMTVGHGGEIYGRVFSRGWNSNPNLTGTVNALVTGFGSWDGKANQRIHIPKSGIFPNSKECWMYSILAQSLTTVGDDLSFFDKNYVWGDTISGDKKPINIGTNRLKVTISGFGVRYFSWRKEGTAYSYYSELFDIKLYDFFQAQDAHNVEIKIEKA